MASKAGLNALTKVMTLEWARYSIQSSPRMRLRGEDEKWVRESNLISLCLRITEQLLMGVS